MIYGQPITFGGAGGNELIVTAPTGSIVTATKDGVTKTATENNGVYIFKGLEAGNWTVTATKDGSTATKSVTFVDEQSIGISYYVANFADNDWETIIAACQSGSVPDTWVVGDSKTMTINGTSYTIDIIGKNHDTYTAGGTAPLTFQMHDCYATTFAMNSTATTNGGYDSSNMHTLHLPGILNTMPSEVQAAIKPVNKKASEGNASSTIETISCNLFLPAEIEVFGSATYSVAGEGSQYAFYQNGGSKVKNISGNANTWLLRSPHSYYSDRVCSVNSSGESYHQTRANTPNGVAPCFCF